MWRLTFGILLTVGSLWGQTDRNYHGWLQYFGDHPLGKTRWGVHLEGQYRRHNGFSQWQGLLLRPAVNFRVNRRVELSGGYGFIESYRYGAYPAARRGSEHRLYQDFKYKLTRESSSLVQRFRLEQRWLPGGLYENRFRYQIRQNFGLGRGYSIGVANEIFVPVKPEQFPRWADQNRLQLLVGRQVHRNLRVETGYMLQTLWQRNGRVREDNHTIVLAFTSDRPLVF
jgi:hypothetical protein